MTQPPASVRYNNPGATYPAPWMKKYGMVGAATIGGGHKIAQFPDPVSGAAANFDLYGRNYVGKPLGQAINTWSGGNSADAYGQHVAKATGRDLTAPITPEEWKDPSVAVPVMQAMSGWESGKGSPLSDDQWRQAHSTYIKGGTATMAPPAPQGMIRGPSISPEWDQKVMALGGPAPAPRGMIGGLPSKESDDRLAAYATSMSNQAGGTGWENLGAMSGKIIGGMLLGQVADRDRQRQASESEAWKSYGAAFAPAPASGSQPQPSAPQGMIRGTNSVSEPVAGSVAASAIAAPGVGGMVSGAGAGMAGSVFNPGVPRGMIGAASAGQQPPVASAPATDPRLSRLDQQTQALLPMLQNPSTREYAQRQMMHIEDQRLSLMNPDTALEREAKTLATQKTKAEIDKLNREAQSAGAVGPYKDMKQKADVEEGLRKEFTKAGSEFTIIRDSAAKIEAIAKAPSAASDIAMIYSFMKILDPGSVVRETEYATAQNAAGVPDQLKNVWNRVLTGERLADTQRADFLAQARTLAETQQRQYSRTLEQYRGVSRRLGLDEQNVILDQRPEQNPQPGHSAKPAGTTAPKSAAEYQALPSGSRFIDPTGQERIKP